MFECVHGARKINRIPAVSYAIGCIDSREDLLPGSMDMMLFDPTAAEKRPKNESVFFITPTELKGVLRSIQDNVDDGTLIGPEFDLSFHGKTRARYMLSQKKMIAKLVYTIDSAIEMHDVERETFIVAFDFENPKMALVAQSICKSYEMMFQIYYRNLQQSF